MTYDVLIDGQSYRVELERLDAGAWRARVNGREFILDAVRTQGEALSLIVEGRAYEVERETVAMNGLGPAIVLGGRRYRAEVRDPRSLGSRRAAAAQSEGPRRLLAPMPGKVIRVLAPENTAVEAGAGEVVIEAMKMQNEIKSPKRGVVRKVMVAVGSTVNAGDVLAIVE